MKRVAVLTSGGDAPGMNAAIRAVVRAGIGAGFEMFGVKRGYAGLLEGAFLRLDPRSVGGIIHAGGTMLGSARSPEFETSAGRHVALTRLEEKKIEALVVIGGSGSQRGAHELARLDFPVIGIASTIDNDLYGTEMAIGVDTALNIALEAMDRLRTTASSMERAFLVEVMGRDCGYLALMTGIAGGAEIVAIPEVETTPEEIARAFADANQRGKLHALAIVAEGCRYNAQKIANYFAEHEKRIGFELRVTILGHVQRGGVPTAFDRLLATRSGVAAIDQLVQGKHGVLIGLRHGEIAATPLDQVAGMKNPLDLQFLELARVLAQ
ncbi:MAG: 6-phosphofructokinase [Chloroflexi bacterium]|nr:6-phosphofructokinase [Chloroflexota bacterium]